MNDIDVARTSTVKKRAGSRGPTGGELGGRIAALRGFASGFLSGELEQNCTNEMN